ncbi:hypothetical protein ACWDTB_29965, partial [Streptomyces sp. NPDC003487]
MTSSPYRMPAPYRMPGAMFDAVAAGGGGAEALRLLARAEHSRRLACAWAVTDAAYDGELDGLGSIGGLL